MRFPGCSPLTGCADTIDHDCGLPLASLAKAAEFVLPGGALLERARDGRETRRKVLPGHPVTSLVGRIARDHRSLRVDHREKPERRG